LRLKGKKEKEKEKEEKKNNQGPRGDQVVSTTSPSAHRPTDPHTQQTNSNAASSGYVF